VLRLEENDLIETANLRLEPIRQDHAVLLFIPLSDAQLYTLIPEEPPKSSDALAKRYVFWAAGKSPDGKEHWLNWAMFNRHDGRPVGTFQATVRDDAASDIAYIVFKAHWRQGIAREAGKAVIGHIFNHYRTPLIAANMDTRNIASVKLVEALGLKRVAYIADADNFKGMASDEYRYELPRGEWNSHGTG
jgi:ribosomal-protein-alanine N-acetyltransferase